MAPLKPEKLRNNLVSKPGFGDYRDCAVPTTKTPIRVNVTQTRHKLLKLQKNAEHSAWREESKARNFCRAYVDNEEDDEEQKKVLKTRDSLPFGMNIRSAAHKAAFGTGLGPL